MVLTVVTGLWSQAAGQQRVIFGAGARRTTCRVLGEVTVFCLVGRIPLTHRLVLMEEP